MTKFTTIFGKEKEVEPEKITFRPTAYGIIVRGGMVLLEKVKTTGKWFIPGGAIETSETLIEGLQREVHEETGYTVEVGELLEAKEHFFYYDPLDKAFHMFMFFYQCTLEKEQPDPIHAEDIEETEKPQWVAIRDLKLKDFDEVLHSVISNLMKKS